MIGLALFSAFAQDLELTIENPTVLDPEGAVTHPYSIDRVQQSFAYNSDRPSAGQLVFVRPVDRLAPRLYQLATQSLPDTGLWTFTGYVTPSLTGERVPAWTIELDGVHGTEWHLVLGTVGASQQVSVAFERYRRCDYDTSGGEGPPICSSWDFENNVESW